MWVNISYMDPMDSITKGPMVWANYPIIPRSLNGFLTFFAGNPWSLLPPFARWPNGLEVGAISFAQKGNPGIPTIKSMGVNITTKVTKGFNHRNWVNHYFIGGGRPGVRLIPKKPKEALFMSWLVVTIFHGVFWWGNLGDKDLKAYDELNLILGLFGFFFHV